MNFSEETIGGISRKKLFIKISQYSQESCRLATLLKTDSNTGIFPEYCEIFKNTYFEEHLLAAASDFLKRLQTSEQLLLN